MTRQAKEELSPQRHMAIIKIAKRIKNIRVLRGYSQGELGRILNKTSGMAQSCETGQVRISVNDLWLLAMHYGVPIEYFFQDLYLPATLVNSAGKRAIASQEDLPTETLTNVSLCVSRRVKFLRILRGHTQADLCTLYNVTPSQISCLETGRTLFSADALYAVAHHYLAPAAYFFQDIVTSSRVRMPGHIADER